MDECERCGAIRVSVEPLGRGFLLTPDCVPCMECVLWVTGFTGGPEVEEVKQDLEELRKEVMKRKAAPTN